MEGVEELRGKVDEQPPRDIMTIRVLSPGAEKH